MGFLVGIIFLGAPPLALATSIAGLIKDQSKKYAVAGLIISGLTCWLLLWQMLWH